MIHTYSENYFFILGITSLYRDIDCHLNKSTIFIDLGSHDLKCGNLYQSHSRFLRVIFVDDDIYHIANRFYDVDRALIIHKKTPLNDIIIQLEEFIKKQSRREISLEHKTLPITLREQQVLAHLLTGETPHYCAHRLGINIKTVSQHKRSAIKKLGFKNSRELYTYNKSIQALLKHGGFYQ